MRRLLNRILVYVILGGLAITMVVPFVAMLSQSLKVTGEYIEYPFKWIPDKPTLANYSLLLGNSKILRWTLNSLVISGGTAILQVITASLAGYGFARKRFRGRDAIFWVMMLQLMLPTQVTIIPIFLMLSKLQLVNTYWAFFLPFGTSIFSTFLMRQAMLTIPMEYDEAAKMDGANDFHIYRHVILPMCRPTFIVLAIFAFLAQWNDFFYALIVTQSDKMRTLQVGLATLQPIGGSPGVLMAGATFAFMPTLILYLTQQRYIVEGLQAGGLKG